MKGDEWLSAQERILRVVLIQWTGERVDCDLLVHLDILDERVWSR